MKKAFIYGAIAGIGTAALSSYLYETKVKKRSYRSFLTNTMTKAFGPKRFLNTDQKIDKMIALKRDEQMETPTPTDYRFKHRFDAETQDNSIIYTINDKQDRDQRVILYVHGGAWIEGPFKEHYKLIDTLAETFDAKVVAPNYPKIPTHDHHAAFNLLASIYKDILNDTNDANQITLMGDSAGGHIALSFAQYLNELNLAQPKDIIALSPCVESRLNHPDIYAIQPRDAFLTQKSLRRFLELWANGLPDGHYKVSPKYGNFEDLGKVTFVIGTDEIFYPNVVDLSKTLDGKGISHNLIIGHNLFHDYAIMPIPEQKEVISNIKHIIEDNRTIKDRERN
ncbi:acetyl esterase/lipase [Staphylococcus caledonicus]|uniref:alpha/beta hydrolase fold domain-containing protein n=1 Tax=Staphylococcus caledonicus TaxID=2741333 RepID=UPI003C2BF3E3